MKKYLIEKNKVNDPHSMSEACIVLLQIIMQETKIYTLIKKVYFSVGKHSNSNTAKIVGTLKICNLAQLICCITSRCNMQ